MDDLHQTDFREMRLQLKGDFDIAYYAIVGTGLAAYMKKFLVLQPRLWLCQFYGREIVHQSLKKFYSSYPGNSDTLKEHDNISPDLSSCSFPMKCGQNFQRKPYCLTIVSTFNFVIHRSKISTS